jgi:sterol desaturase/sphingolipid hydroxylase (fatty acid hydroxylase superfamily)
MEDKSILNTVLMDVTAQVGLLAASLVAFVLIGGVFYAAVRKNRSWTALYQFMFPFHRYTSRQLHVDLWMLIASRLLWFPIINAIGVIVISLDVQALLIDLWGARKPAIEPGWFLLAIQLGITYLSLEFSGYWAHRFLHTQGFLWYTHRAHHSAEVLTFLVGGRGHPLEHIVFLVFGLLFGGVTMGTFLFLFGTAMHPGMPMALILMGLFGAVMDKISHSELPMSFGPLDYVFMSARMHQIHHSAETHHRNKNFGGTMSLFDWIFGTAYRPAREEEFRLGMSPDEVGANNPHYSLRALYFEPFTLIWQDHLLRKSRAKKLPEEVGVRDI